MMPMLFLAFLVEALVARLAWAKANSKPVYVQNVAVFSSGTGESDVQVRFQVFGEGVNRQGVRLQYLAAATTLKTCLEHPFTQPTPNKLLHTKQQK